MRAHACEDLSPVQPQMGTPSVHMHGKGQSGLSPVELQLVTHVCTCMWRGRQASAQYSLRWAHHVCTCMGRGRSWNIVSQSPLANTAPGDSQRDQQSNGKVQLKVLQTLAVHSCIGLLVAIELKLAGTTVR